MPPFGQFGPQSVAQSAPGANTYELRLRELERRVNELVTAQSLNYATVGTGGVLKVDGTCDVAGNLYVTGHAAIAGTLSLPDGIIDNAALADPITVTAFSNDATGLTFPTGTPGNYATSTITVPAGFTHALIMATANAGLVGAGGACVLACQLETTAGFGAVGTGGNATVVTGANGQAVDCLTQDETGLVPGSTFTIFAQGSTPGHSTSLAGEMSVSGFVVFLR